MPSKLTFDDQSASQATKSRSQSIFQQQLGKLHRETHGIFVLLLIMQWLVGIGLAVFLSPWTWIGDQSQVHVHIWAAIVLGGIISSLPIFLAIRMPNATLTRHVIAISQMLWSALLIHLSGGRIETHFHIFGSLAFLAFYRDWRVIFTATAVVTMDHMLRGIFWPQSAFGVLVISPYRWMEHTVWVVFEDVFLIISCRRGIRQMREISDRQSLLEQSHQKIESTVQQRTAELTELSSRLVAANESLKTEVREHGQAEQRFRVVIEASPNGILKVNHAGSIELVNRQVETLFGYDRDELLGVNIEVLMPGQFPNAQDAQFLSALIESDSQSHEEHATASGRRKDGTEFPIEMGITSVMDNDRSFLLFTIIDLSSRHAAEIELRHTQNLEAVGRLASGVAHEINTPMQFIGDNLTYLERAFGQVCDLLTMYRDLPDGEGESITEQLEPIQLAAKSKRLEKMLKNIPMSFVDASTGVQRVSTIVQAMKEFTHPGTDQQEFANINQLISATVTVSRNEWKFIADLTSNLDPSVPNVLCNPVEINQVLLNLVINATQAIGQQREMDGEGAGKGQIEISTTHLDDWVTVLISDSGPGIPNEVASRIFEPFFTTKAVGQGSGQGLAIAHAVIVQRHGGTITAEPRPSGGTNFIVKLPVFGQNKLNPSGSNVARQS